MQKKVLKSFSHWGALVLYFSTKQLCPPNYISEWLLENRICIGQFEECVKNPTKLGRKMAPLPAITLLIEAWPLTDADAMCQQCTYYCNWCRERFYWAHFSSTLLVSTFSIWTIFKGIALSASQQTVGEENCLKFLWRMIAIEDDDFFFGIFVSP